jgi:hypothetical protein
MNRETGRSGGAAAELGTVPGQAARFAKSEPDPMMSLPPGACPGGETAMRPSGAEGTGGDNDIMPRLRPLSGSTACNEAVGHKQAANVERKGGWTVLMAIDAARQSGQDGRPGMAEARRRGAEDAKRLRARCIPRVGAVADIVRWDGLPGGVR